MQRKKPVTPVKPARVELLYLYPCPYCGREVALVSPVRPSVAQCDSCEQRFPIVPVDEKDVRYFKLMQAGGPAGIDPDFV